MSPRAKKTKTEPVIEESEAGSVGIHRHWLIALALVFFSIAWIVSLATYTKEDPPLGTGGVFGESQNALGIIGSHIAYWSIQLTFGRYPTFVLPLLLLWFTVFLLVPKWRFPWLRGFLPALVGAWLAGLWIAFTLFVELGRTNSIERSLLTDELVERCAEWASGVGTFLILLFLTLSYIGLVFGKLMWRGLQYYLERRRLARELLASKPIITKPDRSRPVTPPPVISLEPEEEDITVPPRPEPKRKEAESASPSWGAPLIVKPQPTVVVKQNEPDQEVELERSYKLPPLELFAEATEDAPDEPYEELADKLLQTLKEFNVQARVSKIHPGPVVTRYDFIPGPGVKVSAFANLSDDIARAMRAISVRILAPIPGEDAVGIEIPNRQPRIVRFREVAESAIFQRESWILPVAVGLSTDGQPIVTDLTKLPHLLIAGTTGSGKSVFINCLLASLLLRRTPGEVKIALIDPKQLELSPYKVLVHHHLVQLMNADPVVTKPAQAVKLLNACVREMERRLDLLTEAGVRDLREYRERHRNGDPNAAEPLSYLVVVIDELADLMIASAKEVEDPIQRISQMARATGIHLIVATQRPSVNVITGVIKANLPARLGFMVASQTDSRTILDQNGAEKLLGKGDSLFYSPADVKPVRVHGCLIETREIEKLLKWVADQPRYDSLILEPPRNEKDDEEGGGSDGDLDPLFAEAARICVRAGQGSVALIRRRIRVGFSRAGRLLDQLEAKGVVGPFDGSKPREILISMESLEEMIAREGLGKPED